MTCLEFRRACQADPNGLGPEHRAHMRDCPVCARFAGDQLAFDQRLEAAMRVEPPDGLRARVVFERSLRSRRRLRWLAVAAVAVFSVGASMTAYLSLPSPLRAGELVAHMRADPLHEMPADAGAGDKLARIAGDLGLAWRGEVGHVVRAKLCDVDGHEGVHLVVEAHGMRVSAFVMPGITAADAGRLERAGMPGMIVQTPEGAIAVFCPEASTLADIGERLRRAVSWSAA